MEQSLPLCGTVGAVTIQAGLVDVPWSRDGFRMRVLPFALKGHAMTAQGNALGILPFDTRQALKGRHKVVPPFQGLCDWGTRTQGVALG